MAPSVVSQADKTQAFRALHARDRAFIIPNPWDPGTARLLASLGFEALATTSAGYAFSQGVVDGAVDGPRDAGARRGHCRGDGSSRERGPRERLWRRSRVGSGDDSGGGGHGSRRRLDRGRHARARRPNLRDRARGGSCARRGGRGAISPAPFVLTARAENFLHGQPNLGDTIARLQAFQEAGADVLYAPGLRTADEIATVVRSVDRPVNVLMGLQAAQLDLATLSALGVKRVSVGSALSRAALGAFLRAAREMRDHGTFTFASDAVSYREISAMLAS